MNSKVLKWINTAAFLIMITVNILADMIPIGIGKTGEISEKYLNLFTPTPVTFSIWGLIYLCTGLFVIYQWGLFDHGISSDIIREKIGLWFAASCIFNTCWILAWHMDVIWLSVVLIAALLGCLLVIIKKNRIQNMDIKDKICVTAGFDIYFGWITAAFIANLGAFFTGKIWGGFGTSVFLTVIFLIAGTLAGLVTVFPGSRKLSALAIIWAYNGILIKHVSPEGFGGKYPVVIIFTIAGIVLMLCGIILKRSGKRRFNVTDNYIDI